MIGNRSFRSKLLYSFLVVGILPLLMCMILMINIFGMAIERSATEAGMSELDNLGGSVEEAFLRCERVLDLLGENARIREALSSDNFIATQSVYYDIYSITDNARDYADFSVMDANGRQLFTTSGRSEQLSLPTDWGLLRKAKESHTAVYADVESFSQQVQSAKLRCALAIRKGRDIIGYAVAGMSDTHFQRIYESRYTSTNAVAIIDELWRPIYCSQPIIERELLPQLRQRLIEEKPLAEGRGRYLYYIAENKQSGAYLLLIQPRPLSVEIERLLYGTAIGCLALCLALCAIFAMRLSRQLFEPVRALNAAMAELEGGNLDARSENVSTDEMGQLAGRFNRMAQRLKEYLNDSIARQRQLAETQVRMMQAQLNPHFLYNTLDTIKWIGKINSVPQVATIAADLADILRTSISGGQFVSLKEELTLLDRYVEIQKIRFPDKFSFTADIEPQALDVTVPKLMLQPLVENSIIHGFEDGGEPNGVISVTARIAGDKLKILVEDNGCGMSRESVENFESRLEGKKGHLGLYNVDAILRLHYGEEYGVKLMPAREKGTCIAVTLPIGKEDK